MAAALEYIGRRATTGLEAFGRFWLFSWHTVAWIPSAAVHPRNWLLFLRQAYLVGVLSVPIILITGFFIGMILAVQAMEQFRAVGMDEWMGVLVNLSVVRELGPVFAAVMLAGRIGGALTAELGTMNVTEQIDALRAMGADPLRYLVVPRFLACLLLTPLLTLYCNLMGAVGGWLISVQVFHVPPEPYWRNTALVLESWDLFNSILKSFAFGGTIGLISCFKGFTCKPGAAGVGTACTEAFVANFLSLIMLDFFIGFLLKTIYEGVWGYKPVLF